METKSTTQETDNNESEGGVVYRTSCQHPGCGHIFDLRITPANASLLSGTVACPRCRRHGGMLKPQGRLGPRLFSAKLIFGSTGPTRRIDDDELSDSTELR